MFFAPPVVKKRVRSMIARPGPNFPYLHALVEDFLVFFIEKKIFLFMKNASLATVPSQWQS
jgi:hypothetical protein